MKKLVIMIGSCFLCVLSFLPTACAAPEQMQENLPTATVTIAVTPSPTFPLETTATPSPTAEPVITSVPNFGEIELLKLLEDKTGASPESFLCTDFDHNGTDELFAVLSVDYQYQIWYCSSDGTVCEKVYESFSFFDACEVTCMKSAGVNETHIVINLYNMMGTNKQFAILALRENDVDCLVPWHYGTAGVDAEGKPCMTVEAYDGCYDVGSGMWLMHTWKQTWLTFDEDANTYREIPATKISGEDFWKFANAAEYLEQIRERETKEDTAEIMLEYFCRANGILHVQCFVTDTSGNIAARYYTMIYENDTIISELGQPNDGIMQEKLSGLEAAE